MFKFRFALNVVVVMVASLVFVCLAQAQVVQTFVSAQQGDDAHDCSLIKPCRTFTRAINEVKPGGEVTALDSGDYQAFSINKAVTVQAAPGVYAGITVTSNSAVFISAGANDVVVVRGLTLNSLGGNFGIIFNAGAALHVESCTIHGFAQHGISFNAAAELFVKDTVVRNSNAGIFINTGSGTAKGSIDRCRLENGGSGLQVNTNTKVTARDTVASGNSIRGFGAMPITGGVGELNLENCVASGNETGIQASSGGTIRVSNSTITNNLIGISSGGVTLSRLNNTVEGNTGNGSFSGTFAAK